jgi:hypothetical protein
MKLFCECNSSWLPHFIGDNFDDLSVFDLGTMDTRQVVEHAGEQGPHQCPDCLFNYWYEADHENHMFDLKNMNE